MGAGKRESKSTRPLAWPPGLGANQTKLAPRPLLAGSFRDAPLCTRDGDRIFRTYFIDSRGDEAMGSTWSYLDITALGRQEEWEDSPEGYPQTPPYQWWNYHDAYGETA